MCYNIWILSKYQCFYVGSGAAGSNRFSERSSCQKSVGILSVIRLKFSSTRSGCLVPGIMHVMAGCANTNCDAAAFILTLCLAATASMALAFWTISVGASE